MPIYTTHYITFRQNIQKLIGAILPTQNPLLSYTAAEIIRIRSFSILAHAEIEYYIEQACEEILHATRDNLNVKNNAKIRAIMLSHYSCAKEKKHPQTLNHQEMFKWYASEIKKNHGIKESNIYTLLMPLGINLAKIDNVLLISLDDYGLERGRIAHNAISHPHPSLHIFDTTVQINKIQTIVNGIKVLDRKLKSLLK